MEPGTKFCPDHRNLKVPPFADYCSVCNRRLVVHGHTYPDTADIGPHFQADEIKPLDPAEEAQVMKHLAEDEVAEAVIIDEAFNFPGSIGDHIFRTGGVEDQFNRYTPEELDDPAFESKKKAKKGK